MSTLEYINNAPQAPAPVGAYSQAVAIGDTLYLAGQVGLNPETGSLVEGGLEAQAKQVFANVKAVLAHAGSSVDKIAMTTIFLADIQDGKRVNELYAEFINSKAAPARQTLAVKDLPLGAAIEISVIAAR